MRPSKKINVWIAELRSLGVVEFCERTVTNFFRHRMTTYAAALAYRGLFGLFPFILLVVTLLTVLHFDGVFEWLIDQAKFGQPQNVNGPLESAAGQNKEHTQLFQQMVDRAREEAGGKLLWFGVAVALWSTSALARTLNQALNGVYEVIETRSGRKRFVLSVAFGPVLAVAVLFAVGLMLIGPRVVERVAGVVNLDELFVLLWTWLRLPVALLLLAVVLCIVYRYGPNVEHGFGSTIAGAGFAVVAWAITSVGFSFYLANFANYGVTYGSLGTAIGLLLYLYLSASVVLIGAEVNAAIHRHTRQQEGKEGRT